MEFEDLYSLPEVQGCFLYAWLALNLTESSYRSQPAQMKNENGTLGYGCYSSSSMLGIVCMDVMECVCKGFSQNARVEVFVEVKLQKGLCFCSKKVFLWIRRFEGWFGHVSNLVWCLESFHEVCFCLCLQEVNVVYLLQCFFLSKQRLSSWIIGYYRPLKHAANLVLDQWDLSINLCPKDLACTSLICEFDIKHFFIKMVNMLFPYMD